MHKLVSKTLIAAAVATTMVAGSAQAASHAESITVVSWGGAYTTSQVEAYHKPWMAKTGNTIVSEDYNGGLAEIKAQVLADGEVTMTTAPDNFKHALQNDFEFWADNSAS